MGKATRKSILKKKCFNPVKRPLYVHIKKKGGWEGLIGKRENRHQESECKGFTLFPLRHSLSYHMKGFQVNPGKFGFIFRANICSISHGLILSRNKDLYYRKFKCFHCGSIKSQLLSAMYQLPGKKPSRVLICWRGKIGFIIKRMISASLLFGVIKFESLKF